MYMYEIKRRINLLKVLFPMPRITFGDIYLHSLLSIWQYTVISWLRGEQSNYCPEVVEKIWETVARGRRPLATVSQIFSITSGQ